VPAPSDRPSGPTAGVLRALHVDPSPAHLRPARTALAAATLAALTGSVGACAVIVWAGTRLVPGLAGYTHFRFAAYAPLTVVGVLAACVTWPVAAHLSPTPRWVLFRLAVLVTAVLWVPDLVLLARHQPGSAVLILMTMHLAVAVVTYQCLVRMAPAAVRPVAPDAHDPDRPARRMAAALAAVVGVELLLGVATLVAVPTGRPSGWLPPEGAVLYLAHALVGLPLAVGAVVLLSRVRGSSRILALTGWIGLVGVAVAGVGGVLTASHPLRIVGIALMLLGPVVAVFGYLLPVLDRWSEDEASG